MREDVNDELNQSQIVSREMLKKENLDTLELYSEAKNKIMRFSSASYSLLDELITQIHHEGNLGDVQIVMEKVDNTIKRYKEDAWRRIVLPAPFMLINSVESRFRQEASIKRLIKAFDYEPMDVKMSFGLYIFKLVFLAITVIATFVAVLIQGWFWLLLLFIPFFVTIYALDFWFAGKVINQTGFVPLYQRIRSALLRRIQAQEELIENSYKVPEAIEQRMLEYEKNTAFQQLESSEKEQVKRLEYESLERLQGISAAVALHQAKTNAEVKKIQNIPELQRMEAEIRIKSPEREHQIILAEIKAMEKILKEKVKAIGNNDIADQEMLRDIQRWESMCRGWRGKLRKGSAGIADIAQEVEETVKKVRFPTTNKPTEQNNP
jgi:ABC-type multidrug transport system fused ATPase/permease subunit